MAHQFEVNKTVDGYDITVNGCLYSVEDEPSMKGFLQLMFREFVDKGYAEGHQDGCIEGYNNGRYD